MEHQKILFEHHNSLEGSYAIESAWGILINEGQYKIDNILFYAPEYAWGDIVSVESRGNELFVNGLIQESGHSTIRIIFNNANDVQIARDYLAKMGCDSEISDIKILIAVDIPPEVKYLIVKDYLNKGESLGKWSYEEACIAHQS